jgi:hypothetical protein
MFRGRILFGSGRGAARTPASGGAARCRMRDGARLGGRMPVRGLRAATAEKGEEQTSGKPGPDQGPDVWLIWSVRHLSDSPSVWRSGYSHSVRLAVHCILLLMNRLL